MRTFLWRYVDILRMYFFCLFLITSAFFSLQAAAFQSTSAPVVANSIPVVQSLAQWCYTSLKSYKSYDKLDLEKACGNVLQKEKCTSVEGRPIYHYDKKGKNDKAKNILVVSMIHGDETGAGALGRYWLERLQSIEARNNWRVIPLANPDGALRKTRANASGVDLNRNFPTQDWEAEALKYWKNKTKSSLRKYPGAKAASEPEVNCLMEHITEFKPEFVISIHTPLNVLDYDGPQVPAPNYNYLPWRRLGHFPGSLGRYLWVEQQIPVLTAELKPTLPAKSGVFDDLQDVIGYLVQTKLNQ